MLPGKFLKKRLLGFLLLIAISAIAGAQEPRKRTPGQILRPQHAGILLMETRIKMENPDKVLQFLALKDGDIVADIGCGNGFYTLRLADEVSPHGVVFAVDVQQGMLDQLAERRKEANISNVYPILGRFEDPLLPPGKVDWILLVDAYHEFSNPEAMLARMKDCLAPGGRVALIEYRGERNLGMSRSSIPHDHSMTIDQVMHEWIPAGFELVTLVEFLPMQHFFVFKNAGDKSRPAIRTLAIENTPNVSTFDNRFYFAGQPDEEALKKFADFGVKTVINLRNTRELTGLGFDEKEVVEETGMTYVHAPMGFEIPDASTLREILSALDTANDAPVLLHCTNANRVGAIWSLYARQQGDLSIDEAIAEGKAAGMSLSALEMAAREALSNR
ncbi:MAG: methyltransferase domain-containing protein [Acidobacteria bacterium]|nr:methyltransferase domain-containing protein [Acidobacteriota bacterium]